MSANDPPLTGPDLERGIDASDLTGEGMLVGHAGGEAVLVARCGAEVFAIGATCTHYGGPLGEGLRVGETVRCPWHHACFSLRTGESLRPPALTDLPSFEIEERDGKVRVLGRRALEARAAAAPAAAPESIVLVGAGAAGHTAAQTLRRAGYRGPLTLVGADPVLPYDRPNLSKDYLAGSAPEEWLPLRTPDFYAAERIELRLGSPVTRLDLEARTLHLADGGTLGFGALLLATGADPVHLSFPGSDLPHVRTLRTLADSRALIAEAREGTRVVVVGAGFIGLEVAASLRARGLRVAVVAPDALPLARVLGDRLGAEIRRIHEANGVTFHLRTKPVSIRAGQVLLEDGTALDADLVVVGVGVRPASALAEGAGLAVDRGVVVDEQLRTTAPGVFAAGDLARWPDPRTGQKVRVEHWVVAQRQGQVAAWNMLGDRRRFDAVPFFWSAHHGTTINYVGHAEAWEREDVVGSLADHDGAVAFRSGGKTLAVATLGRDRLSLDVEAAMERDDEDALQALVPAAS